MPPNKLGLSGACDFGSVSDRLLSTGKRSLMWQKEGRKLLSSSCVLFCNCLFRIQDYLTVARFPQLKDQNMQQIGYKVVSVLPLLQPCKPNTTLNK